MSVHNNTSIVVEPYVFMFKTVSAAIAAFGLPGCVLGCLLAGLFDFWFGRASFQMPALVAYNRYLSLHDLELCQRRFTRNTVFGMFALIVLVDLGWMVPFLATGNVGYDDSIHMCGVVTKEQWSLRAIYISFGLADVISYSVSFYLLFKVVQRMRAHKKGMNQSQIESQVVRESRDIIKAMLAVMLIPLVAQMPGEIVHALSMFYGRSIVDPWIGSVLNSTFSTTAMCNAYVTMYVIKDYRKAVRVIWTKSIEGVQRGRTRFSKSRVEPVGNGEAALIDT